MQQLPTMLGPARNNMQQGMQKDATYNIQQCCIRLQGDLSLEVMLEF